MGSYASVAIRDAQGNITGYRSTSTGEVVEGSASQSPTFVAIQQQYDARIGRVVTSGPEHTYYQGIATNTTAGEGGFSGRAAVYASTLSAPLQRSRYYSEPQAERTETVPTRDLSSNAPTRAEALFPQTKYESQAIQNVQSRPGYTPQQNLGDIQTQAAVRGVGVLRSFGFNVASEDVMTGRTLEFQRQRAVYTPGIRDERYYGGELQKWAENKVELSSAYHDVGMKAGVPIPANRFEYQGDLAVEFLKGKPTKSSEMFSPVSGEMSQQLPSGEGVQQYAWRGAVATDRGQAQPGPVSFMNAVNYLGAAEGQYGPYGYLSGGPNEGRIAPGSTQPAGISVSPASPSELPTWESQKSRFTPQQQAMIQFGLDVSSAEAKKLFTPTTTETIQPTGELPIVGTAFAPIVAPFQQTTVVTKDGFGETRVSGETPFSAFVSKSNRDISSGLGLSQIPTPTNEQIKQMGPLFAGLGQSPIAVSLALPVVSDYTASYLGGEVTAVREKPIEMALSFGAGAAMGVAFKGATVGMSVARTSIAEKAISQGGFWRGAEMFSSKVLPVAGTTLGGLYATDVGMRATNMGRDLTPTAAGRLGGIVAVESRPMGAGAMVGYGAPGAVSRSVKLSDIGYKSALQEGKTTGRLGYYVTEPITSPAKNVFKSTSKFISETKAAGGSPVREAVGVAKFEIMTAYRSKIDVPVRSFVQETTGRVSTRFSTIGKEPISPEVPSRASKLLFEYPELSSRAYPRQPSMFDVKVKPEIVSKPSKLIQEYPELSSQAYGRQPTIANYPRLTYIKARAFWQEKQPTVRDIMLMVKYPKEEIQSINYMARMAREFKPSGGETGVSPATITKSGAGAGASRVISKQFGGKTIGGLSKEPSLKSMGVSERITKAGGGGTTIGSRADYRGKSGSMKPMGGYKQASSQQVVMSEQLPVVEGMTTGKMRQPSQQTGIPGMFMIPQRVGVVSVIEPELEFSQMSMQKRGVGMSIAGVYASDQLSRGVSGTETRQRQFSGLDLGQTQKPRNILEQMQELRQTPAQRVEHIGDAALRKEFGVVSIPGTAFVTDIATRSDITTVPAMTTVYKPMTDLLNPPVDITITTTKPRIKIPPAEPGIGLPTIFGGGRGSPRYGAYYRSKATTYNVGADLLGASRGSFTPMRIPKLKFRMPRF